MYESEIGGGSKIELISLMCIRILKNVLRQKWWTINRMSRDRFPFRSKNYHEIPVKSNGKLFQRTIFLYNYYGGES